MGYRVPPMRTDELRAIECEWRERFESPPFWSPFTITVAIIAMCLGSYMVGVYIGMCQGAAVARALAEAEAEK